MSRTSQIRMKLKQVLEGISPSVGVIHDYERYSNDWAKFLGLMKDSTGLIRGWTITRESSPGAREAPDESLRYPTYLIRGYRGLEDANASEKGFDDDVEAVQDELGRQTTLGGLVDHVEEPQLRVLEPRMFGSVLCHSAEIALKVHVSKTYNLVA